MRASASQTIFPSVPLQRPGWPALAASNNSTEGFSNLHVQEIPLPGRQLASALLAVDPTFLQDDWMGAEYQDLRKLQGRFLRPRKELRTAAVEVQ